MEEGKEGRKDSFGLTIVWGPRYQFRGRAENLYSAEGFDKDSERMD